MFFEALETRTLLASDFGDAPNTGAGSGTGNYETLLANGGPSHDITATQSSLFLGARVDGEADAAQSATANGDDITTLPDDEDGLIEPAQDLVLTVGSIPTVRVRATNTTGVAATLYGWIDYNRDGVFDNSTERASVAVPPATINGIFALTFPAVSVSMSGGATYARFRISSDAAAASAVGPAIGGEVEDYPATMVPRSYGTVDGTTGKKIASGKNGGPSLTNEDNFGAAVATLGDLDRDGVIDLAVGVPGEDTGGSGRGAVDVLFMKVDGTVKSSVKIASGTGGGPPISSDGDEFGISLAPLGDLDGDGVMDLAVGAASDNTGGVPNTGAVYILFLKSDGTAKGSVKIASGINGGPVILRGEHFGWSVAAVGDFDGDGVVDLAVGAIDADAGGFDKGAVYLLRLNSGGTVKNYTMIPNGSGGGLTVPDSDAFGYSVASLGDLDGDGVTDLAVGAPFDDTNGSYRGATYMLLMNADGSVKSSVKVASGVGGAPALANDDFFGSAVVALGDLDGDGVTDLGVGAVGDESSGSFNRGALHVLLLNANGTLKKSTKIADGLGEGISLTNTAYFGRSAALLGDLNGDGLNELAVGAPGDDVEGSNRGAVYVFSLNPPLDFGDAPDTGPGTGANNYQTLLADNGPRHEISTTQTTLYLGARVDGEVDAKPNLRGTGDDLTALPDDEDGVVEPAQDLALTVGAAPRVRVRATNATVTAATLYGWIDYNRDGVFDNGTERASVTVPPASASGTFILQFPAIPAGTSSGATTARFRLSSDPAAANPVGVAVGGEVEDHSATISLSSGGSVISSKTKRIASGISGGPALANGDYFGSAMVSLGDLDGDGVPDLAVGARYDDTGGNSRGAVYVQFMQVDGTVKSNVKIASGLNGGPTLTNNDFFGSSLASLGDLDGDGVTDIAVGANGDNLGGIDRGAVYILRLKSDGTVKGSLKIAQGSNGGPNLADGDYFGRSLASIGDLNGDGVTELLVGANRDDTGGTNGGAAYVLFLNSDGSVKTRTKIANATNGGPTLASGDYFGVSVASLGDLDGDGVTDAAVGAFRDDTGGSDRGAVYVLMLNANGTVKNSVKVGSGVNGGPALTNGDEFGRSVTAVGDLNADGITDLAVGAVRDDTGGTDRGALYVLLLNRSGTVLSRLKVASDTNGGPALTDGDIFGISLAYLGDLNGDGRPDLVAGASGDDTGGADRGAVYSLFLGLPPDFGDAPDTGLGTGPGNYATLLADDGPRHDITTTQNSLYLGVRVDSESDATPNAKATGDDTKTAPNDEDGVVEPVQDLRLTSGAVPEVRVRATNTTGSAAKLYGWIDYNRDGVFDNATERASATVPSATISGTFTLTFPTIPLSTLAGTTYARFRLSSDPAAANAIGPAVGGEVEDYPASITLPSDGTVNSAKTKKIASDVNGGPMLADGDNFGSSVASIGDLDGDGVTDLAIGAAVRGVVYVEFMNADGTAKSSVKIASGVNGGPSFANSDGFGTSVASLGDLDGDGVTDLAVGAIGDDASLPGDSNKGAVYMLFLKTDGTVKSSVKIASGVNGGPTLQNYDEFGIQMTSLGDLNGDGVTDLAVSAPGDDTGGQSRGAVYLLFMNASGSVKSSTKIASDTGGGPTLTNYNIFGISAASLGDIDGDGVTDLAVGARTSSTGQRGAVYILRLNPDGTVKSSNKIDGQSGGGPLTQDYDDFGFSLASVGDLDGDGVTDLVAGAVGDIGHGSAAAFRGAAYVLLLNANGTVKRYVKIADSLNGGPSLPDNEHFGTSVASLGDLNGDGITDLAVGAVGDTTGGGAFRGGVFVLFLNSPTDFGDAPDNSPGTGTADYQTLLANNGPRHNITATQTTLFLGARVDGESDAVQNTRADGDDITTLPDDEDGLIEPAQDLLLTVGSVPTVRVRATNTTGIAATLYGWTDVNRDGVFDNATERTSVPVPAGTTNGTFTLTFPTIPITTSAGATYARFRLSADTAAANPTGLAIGGEIEDYTASIMLQSDGTANSAKTKKIASDTNGGPSLSDGAEYGRAVASLGDLDGNGVADLAVGASYDSTGGANRGAVYVEFMNADGTVSSSQKIASGVGGCPNLSDGDHFGETVASLGDLNGDGVNDLLVGSIGDNTGGGDRGAAYALFLNSNGTVKSSVKIASGVNGGPSLADGDYFGVSATTLGDLDGDGVTDLAVSSIYDDTGGPNRGAVYILFMNANGTVKSSSEIANATNGGPTLDDFGLFGRSMASLGDLNGDGVTDLAVGAARDSTGGEFRGALYVLFLNANGSVKSSVKIADSLNGAPALENDDVFGRSAAPLGDINGDGVADLAVGADSTDVGGTNRGVIYELLMNRDGTVKKSIEIGSDLNGGPDISNDSFFGDAVAALGDLNGDGVTELAVGALGDPTGGTNRGAVYVLFLKSPNHSPSFSKGPNESATDEDAAQSFPGWATAISPGSPDEAGQTLHFVVNNDNNDLFVDQPDVDPSGKLTFTPKPNAHGAAIVTVTLFDDGGTINGGGDVSQPQQFTITVTKPHRLFNAAETGPRRGLDVTGSTSTAPDGFIAANDVLAVINYINAHGSGPIPNDAPYGPPYVDVTGPNNTGDNQVVAEDVLKIINYINANPGQSEAEAAAASQPVTSSLPSDLIFLLAMDIAEQGVSRRRLR